MIPRRSYTLECKPYEKLELKLRNKKAMKQELIMLTMQIHMLISNYIGYIYSLVLAAKRCVLTLELLEANMFVLSICVN